MMNQEQINNNVVESFETLKHIFEVKFGSDVRNISYEIKPGIYVPAERDIMIDGLISFDGDMIVEVNYDETDLTVISSKLRKVDLILNEVFDNYFFTDEGKLVKKRVPAILTGIAFMLYDLKLDNYNEVVVVYLSLASYDL